MQVKLFENHFFSTQNLTYIVSSLSSIEGCWPSFSLGCFLLNTQKGISVRERLSFCLVIMRLWLSNNADCPCCFPFSFRIHDVDKHKSSNSPSYFNGRSGAESTYYIPLMKSRHSNYFERHHGAKK